MDLANPTLTYHLVCLDRACIAAESRKSRLDLLKERFDSREGVSDEVKVTFADQWAAALDIISEIRLTSTNTALTVNDCVANMPLSMMSRQFADTISASAAQITYATDKLVAYDEVARVLSEL